MAEKLRKKEVKRYVEEQLDLGQTVGHITDHLLKYGHSRKEIDEVIDEILNEEETRKRNFIKRASEVLFVVLFVIFVFWVGVSSESSGEALFVGFLPTIIFIILTFIIIERKPRKDILMALPMLIAFLFYISARLSNVDFLQKMDIAKLAFLNLILSYAFVLLMYYAELFGRIKIPYLDELGERIAGKEEIGIEAKENVFDELKKKFKEVAAKEEKAPESNETYIQLPEKHESLKKVVESIESNCKSLNSAIGRVYRKSNGGTGLVRGLIEVKSEWYNAFNYLLKNTDDRKALCDMVDRIEKRLNILFRKEHEIFGTIQFKNLKRDPNGNSRIIDVLIMNDNDPVQTYFENVLKACGETKEIIGVVK